MSVIYKILVVVVLFSFGLTACSASVTPTAAPAFTQAPAATATLTAPDLPSVTETATSTQIPATAPTATLAPDAWMQMPVIPTVSDNAIAIYQRGLELGNDPRRFSKVGDCESTPTWFLGDFDATPKVYSLGEHENLQTVIDYYAGSYGRESLAVKRGANTASLLTTVWADRNFCEKGETMLACEYRLNKPSVALIMLGSNDVWKPEIFEGQMRQIIEYTISLGILPVLSTKADNIEGDHFLNATVTRLAYEYDIPLWNFWLAVKNLPDGGLQEDKAHLTWAANRFDDPFALERAWPWRNLTALQVLDEVRRAVSNP